ncbi:hypothetical protein VAR608DRAFT_0555 [Variovorax sp. HW608]|uniref:hypothetical protein n=1 Tax=Variovorax sp. HW608 TaxID=1034889 RepID=UPI00081FB072|nr:hypothetical protein [Variovorax sp. HW608]SCK11224.1 hypothetical protein VAR608DRAFT_0555 [Variovorax sp. HW608]
MSETTPDPPFFLEEERQQLREWVRLNGRTVAPEDRYRALLEAGELLAAIGFRPYDHYELFGTRLSDHFQQLARSALANFPQPGDLLSMIESGESYAPLDSWLRLPPEVLQRYRESLREGDPRYRVTTDLDDDF